MWRWISVVGACAAGAALGAAAPWIWYYSRSQLLREFAGPPGLGATLLWAVLGMGSALVLRSDRQNRQE